jgi:T5SS/PEP-CTERM-associated repeat protein
MRVFVGSICMALIALCAAPALADIQWSGSYDDSYTDGSGTPGAYAHVGAVCGPGSLTIDTTDGSSANFQAVYVGEACGFRGTITIGMGVSSGCGCGCGCGGGCGSPGLNIANMGYPVSSGSCGCGGGIDGSYGLYVGYYGYVAGNTLNIVNGGQASISGMGCSVSLGPSNYVVLGYGSHTDGTISIDGVYSGSGCGCGCGAVASTFTAQNTGIATYVGYSGTGTLSVTNGGVFQENGAEDNYIGYNGGSTGTVDVSGSGSLGPSTAYLAGTARVGVNGTGRLNITNGGFFYSLGGEIGGANGGSGTAVVDGSSSLWTISGSNSLYIARYGGATGVLHVTNGGTVNNTDNASGALSGVTYVGSVASSSGTGNGTLDFGGSASTLNTRSLFAVASQVTGSNGTINANGLVTDGALAFSSSADLNKSLSFGGATLQLDMRTAANNGVLGAGYAGTGTLKISNGQQVASSYGYLGFKSGSTGTAVITGAGSKWKVGTSSSITTALRVGAYGTESYGTGKLYVVGGGAVDLTAAGNKGTLSVGSGSLLDVDVGKSSSVALGTGGTLANSGTVRMTAAVNVANGAYTPITATTWTGGGAYQAVGGTWNSGTHQFTVSSAVTGTAGTPVSITPSGANQRVLICGGTDGTSTGIGFLSTESALTVTGSSLTGAPLTSLNSLLTGTGTSILDGWMYSTTGGYIAGDPACLSLSLASAYTRDNLSVWGYNGSAWSQLSADDLAFDGSYASFTATALNGWDYAVVGIPIATHHPGDANSDGVVDISDLSVVLANYDKTGMSWSQGDFTGDGTVDIGDLSILLSNYDRTFTAGIKAVPEPSTIALLCAGAIGLLAWRRRRS